ncbi:MAG: hypothetical protein H7Y12_16105 [Sphingobacteriaceae bacterium]|nr:hypothetical protein [Cytophagaceae bacterium]
MSFEEFLVQKKIDGPAFQRAEPARYAEWAVLFPQLHPESFTAQKKFLINDVRRRYRIRQVVTG